MGLYPCVLIGSVFMAHAIGGKTSRIAGWLWIPFSVVVLICFGVIGFFMDTEDSPKDRSFALFAKSMAEYASRQIIVIVTLGLVVWLLAHLNPFFGVDGRDLH